MGRSGGIRRGGFLFTLPTVWFIFPRPRIERSRRARGLNERGVHMHSQSVQEAAAHPSTRWRSLSELVDSRAAGTPTAPAVSFPTGQLSYGELAAGTVEAARQLRAAGVGPGDRVGILLREGCVPYVTFGLGAMRLGAICVPINARNKTHELSYVMEHAGLRVLLTS